MSNRYDRPRVLLDVDGLIRQFTKGALKVVERVTGRHYEITDVAQYDFCAALKLTSDETRMVKQAIGDWRGFASSLDVYPGAIDNVRVLRTISDVRIVTAPWNSNETWMSDTERWLYQNFGIPFTQVTHTHDKASVYGDIFIDDKVEHVRDWIAAWPRKKAVLWRTPHNVDDVAPPGVIATSSWDTVIDLVADLADDLYKRSTAQISMQVEGV